MFKEGCSKTGREKRGNLVISAASNACVIMLNLHWSSKLVLPGRSWIAASALGKETGKEQRTTFVKKSGEVKKLQHSCSSSVLLSRQQWSRGLGWESSSLHCKMGREDSGLEVRQRKARNQCHQPDKVTVNRVEERKRKKGGIVV